MPTTQTDEELLKLCADVMSDAKTWPHYSAAYNLARALKDRISSGLAGVPEGAMSYADLEKDRDMWMEIVGACSVEKPGDEKIDVTDVCRRLRAGLARPLQTLK